jgi:hypothetical protein
LEHGRGLGGNADFDQDGLCAEVREVVNDNYWDGRATGIAAG